MSDDELLVYQYEYWEPVSKRHVASREFATLETIRNGLGVPIFTSVQKVKRDEVIDGFLVPRRKARDTDPA